MALVRSRMDDPCAASSDSVSTSDAWASLRISVISAMRVLKLSSVSFVWSKRAFSNCRMSSTSAARSASDDSFSRMAFSMFCREKASHSSGSAAVGISSASGEVAMRCSRCVARRSAHVASIDSAVALSAMSWSSWYFAARRRRSCPTQSSTAAEREAWMSRRSLFSLANSASTASATRSGASRCPRHSWHATLISNGKSLASRACCTRSFCASKWLVSTKTAAEICVSSSRNCCTVAWRRLSSALTVFWA
mmetsp:Transcript_11480/g.34601  ORF Transcript_11480/g.34601 Transcript_11480/m.34601 type:complete len:251 (+) Transcript_11480:421-1173(+)